MLRELLRQEQSFAFLNPRRVWERRVASPGIHINQVDLVISEDKLFLIFFLEKILKKSTPVFRFLKRIKRSEL